MPSGSGPATKLRCEPLHRAVFISRSQAPAEVTGSDWKLWRRSASFATSRPMNSWKRVEAKFQKHAPKSDAGRHQHPARCSLGGRELAGPVWHVALETVRAMNPFPDR